MKEVKENLWNKMRIAVAAYVAQLYQVIANNELLANPIMCKSLWWLNDMIDPWGVPPRYITGTMNHVVCRRIGIDEETWRNAAEWQMRQDELKASGLPWRDDNPFLDAWLEQQRKA